MNHWVWFFLGIALGWLVVPGLLGGARRSG